MNKDDIECRIDYLERQLMILEFHDGYHSRNEEEKEQINQEINELKKRLENC